MDFFYVFEDCKTKEISKIIIDYNSNQLTKTLEEFQQQKEEKEIF